MDTYILSALNHKSVMVKCKLHQGQEQLHNTANKTSGGSTCGPLK